MPSYILHLLHGKRVLDNLMKEFSVEEKNQYYTGALLPDTKTGKEKGVSHFYSLETIEDVFETPDLDAFARKYRHNLANPLVLGYAAHLFLDWAFFDKFVCRYVSFYNKDGAIVSKRDQAESVVLKRSQKRIDKKKFFSDLYLYGDYTKINQIVIRKYEIPSPSLSTCDNPIEEVSVQEMQLVLCQLERYLKLDDSIDLKLKVFDFYEIDCALQKYAKEFLNWMDSVI